MKVIFLDIDGVLVTVGSMIHNNRQYISGLSTEGSHKAIDPIAVSNLHYILEEVPAVEIVVSSSWRKHCTIKDLQEMFDRYDLPGSFIIGTTPVLDSGYRGHEIGLYLKHNPEITDFVIIDDDADLEPYMDRLVQIDGRNGLTFSDAERVIQKFGETDGKKS